jgi:hypothetical protein
MIDPSIFFRNRTVFWSWILAPLVIRVLVMMGLAAAARVPGEQMCKMSALAASAPELQKATESNRLVLQSFASKKLSSKERFLTDSSDLLYKAGVQGSTQVNETAGPAGSNLKKYQFSIAGSAPSLEDLSHFLDEIGRVDYLQISRGEITEQMSQTQRSYSFSLTFDRVEFDAGAIL